MQHTFTSELAWCHRLVKNIVNLCLLLSLRLFFLHLLQEISRDSVVVLGYPIFFATLFIYIVVTMDMCSTSGISTGEESTSFPALQILYLSILL